MDNNSILISLTFKLAHVKRMIFTYFFDFLKIIILTAFSADICESDFFSACWIVTKLTVWVSVPRTKILLGLHHFLKKSFLHVGNLKNTLIKQETFIFTYY